MFYKSIHPVTWNQGVLLEFICRHWVGSRFGSGFRQDCRRVVNSDWDQSSATKWSHFSFGLNSDLQTLICVLVARPRRCLTLSNPVPWQNWMVAYLGYTLRIRTLFRGWPVMVNDTHTRRRFGLSNSLGPNRTLVQSSVLIAESTVNLSSPVHFTCTTWVNPSEINFCWAKVTFSLIQK